MRSGTMIMLNAFAAQGFANTPGPKAATLVDKVFDKFVDGLFDPVLKALPFRVGSDLDNTTFGMPRFADLRRGSLRGAPCISRVAAPFWPRRYGLHTHWQTQRKRASASRADQEDRGGQDVAPAEVSAASFRGSVRYGQSDIEPWFGRATSGADSREAQSLPLLVFLPGIDGSGQGRLASEQFRRLSVFFDCWAMTVPPEDRSSLAMLIHAIARFIRDHRKAGRQVLLMGESIGAVIALAMALDHPDLVDAVCLINPATAYRQTPISSIAPLLPAVPADLYNFLPALVTPIFGRPGWFDGIVAATADSRETLPGPLGEFARVSRALSEVLPAETLRFREALLRDSNDRLETLLQQLGARFEKPAWCNRTLLLAGDADLVLPSVTETQRLAELLPGARRVVLPGVAHVAFDDATVNLLRLLTDTGIIEALASVAATKPQRLPAAVDLTPSNGLESALIQARSWVSPIFLHTLADGTITRGLPSTTSDAPILLVGNHQLFSLDGPLIIDEFLREQQQLVTALVYPPLLKDESPLEPIPYPFPGAKELCMKFQVQPVSARNLLKALKPGRVTLLFPGGAREAFKRKGEDYKLFWPPRGDLVRLAASVNATIIPFSGLGSDEFFNEKILDTDELLALPVLGDWLRERIKDLPSLVADDIFVPPLVSPRLPPDGPRRNYFLFAQPISTHGLNPKDAVACDRLYEEARGAVERGLEHLLQAREEDPFEQMMRRLPVEQITGRPAPSFSLEGKWGQYPNVKRT